MISQLSGYHRMQIGWKQKQTENIRRVNVKKVSKQRIEKKQTVNENITGCPNKHGNSVTNSISSF